MADWTHLPDMDAHNIQRIGPRTLKQRLEDGSELRRQKSAVVKRVFTFGYTLPGATAQTALAFLKTKGLSTTFTILTGDPESATPATDEATVTLKQLPDSESVGFDVVGFECIFEEA
jgi:hypothetical protein